MSKSFIKLVDFKKISSKIMIKIMIKMIIFDKSVQGICSIKA